MLTADEKDFEILKERIDEWKTREGPRLGDWVIMQDGTVRRFAHDWGDEIQTTHPKFTDASFYFGHGYMSYSGSLDRAIPKHNLTATTETRDGSVWFFKHNFAGAGRGVHFQIPCRVYHQA